MGQFSIVNEINKIVFNLLYKPYFREYSWVYCIEGRLKKGRLKKEGERD